jgi:cytochrome c oxidase accessory protein FixG
VRRLPIAGQTTGSLATDGRRNFVYPADVSGRFHRVRLVIFAVLIAVWIALPLVRINGRPALLLDIATREFYAFGAAFNAQDAWLLFFLLTGLGFGLALVTALWGRVFCGYACPQTVFLDGVFRPIERFIEGSREQRMKLARAPWTAGKVVRKAAKHAAFLVASLGVAHVTLGLFVSLPSLWKMLWLGPAAHPAAFAWAMAITAVLYVDFAWFREQVCLIVCPYGRLQSALTDEDTIVVGYDSTRGEPRGKANDPAAGDCVDCKRCVVVCPTAIDIRDGLQLDCIGCSACVDACDDVMQKLDRKPGLIRYDSQRGLERKPRRKWRPRLLAYAVLGAIGLVVATVATTRRSGFEATLQRERGAPYVVEAGETRNHFTMHLVNKSGSEQSFTITPDADGGLEVALSEDRVVLAPMRDARIRVVAIGAGSTAARRDVRLRVVRQSDGETHTAEARFVGPVVVQR